MVTLPVDFHLSQHPYIPTALKSLQSSHLWITTAVVPTAMVPLQICVQEMICWEENWARSDKLFSCYTTKDMTDFNMWSFSLHHYILFHNNVYSSVETYQPSLPYKVGNCGKVSCCVLHFVCDDLLGRVWCKVQKCMHLFLTNSLMSNTYYLYPVTTFDLSFCFHIIFCKKVGRVGL